MKTQRFKALNKLVLALIGFGLVFSLSNCSKDLEPQLDPLEEITLSHLQKDNDLPCIQSCNIAFADCWNGDGQIGNTYNDFYQYYKCTCLEFQDDCEWMGNNLASPENFSCGQMAELIADWNDECYVPYAICINNCINEIVPDPEADENDAFEDTDGDGILNINDDDDDGDGIPDELDDYYTDTDNDGIPDVSDSDANGDGIPDDHGTGYTGGFVGSTGGGSGGGNIDIPTNTRRCDPPCNENEQCVNGQCLPL